MDNPIKMDDLGVPLFSETPFGGKSCICVQPYKMGPLPVESGVITFYRWAYKLARGI